MYKSIKLFELNTHLHTFRVPPFGFLLLSRSLLLFWRDDMLKKNENTERNYRICEWKLGGDGQNNCCLSRVARLSYKNTHNLFFPHN